MKIEYKIAETKDRRQFMRGTFVTAATILSGGLARILRADSVNGQAHWMFEPERPIIPAPTDSTLWPAYRDQLALWRDTTRRALNYDDALYRRPEFAWCSSAYACCFLMMCDAAFYDPKAGRYTVYSLLDDGLRDFGGYDSVVLWHAYPRIGVDQRNQFDFYRDMPGGLAALREVVGQLHRRGVRAYIDYNPWDKGTRRENVDDLDAIANMVSELDVDGIFLDTMKEGAAGFRKKLDAVRPGVILEGEGTPPLDRLADHHASWAQWFDDSEAPGVLRLKWLERRHMQHEVSRWNHSHASELQTAWMNGSGMMIWENVFGSWLPWNAHDRSLLRAMLPIQRRYATLFHGESWTPLVPVQMDGVYASLWTKGETRLWALINRADREVTGELLKVEGRPGQRYFDLIAGRELKPAYVGSAISLQAAVPARGAGCFLAASSQDLGPDFESFLAVQAAIYVRADDSIVRPLRDTSLRPVAPTLPFKTPPAGMVPAGSGLHGYLNTQMRVRECGFYSQERDDDEKALRGSFAFQTREFLRLLPSHAYAIDETPVTNAQFNVFVRAAAYRPKCVENFLKHWSSGGVPVGREDHPVVWVDLDDARAYAAWAGKRLPTEEEWQFAAQGEFGLEYPWGSGLRAGVCNLGETGDTTPVKAFPAGRSQCGCYDLCGNVWQWTESERSDGRTRFSIIRGGSYFAAQGSNWYVDGGPRPADFATKFLLMWPGLDRCGTVGFRCVVDL